MSIATAGVSAAIIDVLASTTNVAEENGKVISTTTIGVTASHATTDYHETSADATTVNGIPPTINLVSTTTSLALAQDDERATTTLTAVNERTEAAMITASTQMTSPQTATFSLKASEEKIDLSTSEPQRLNTSVSKIQQSSQPSVDSTQTTGKNSSSTSSQMSFITDE